MSSDEVFSETGLGPPTDWRPHYNVAPSQPVLALRSRANGKRELATLKWGLIPSWAHDASVGRRMVMARGETIDQTSAFHDAFVHRRCALVADGFYEWKRDKGGSTPFYFRFTRPMFIAGIWERWRKYGHDVETCAVITIAANATVGQVHDRMPVLLTPTELERWLSADAAPAELHALLVPASEDRVRVFAVDKAVNNPANDSPSLLGDYEEEARLFGHASP